MEVKVESFCSRVLRPWSNLGVPTVDTSRLGSPILVPMAQAVSKYHSDPGHFTGKAKDWGRYLHHCPGLPPTDTPKAMTYKCLPSRVAREPSPPTEGPRSFRSRGPWVMGPDGPSGVERSGGGSSLRVST